MRGPVAGRKSDAARSGRENTPAEEVAVELDTVAGGSGDTVCASGQLRSASLRVGCMPCGSQRTKAQHVPHRMTWSSTST